MFLVCRFLIRLPSLCFLFCPCFFFPPVFPSFFSRLVFILRLFSSQEIRTLVANDAEALDGWRGSAYLAIAGLTGEIGRRAVVGYFFASGR